MGTNRAAVDHLDAALVRSGDGVHQPVPYACLSPSHEAIVAGGARVMPLRRVTKCAPDLSTQKMPFNTRRSSASGTPIGLFGSSGSITSHWKSVRSSAHADLNQPSLCRVSAEYQAMVEVRSPLEIQADPQDDWQLRFWAWMRSITRHRSEPYLPELQVLSSKTRPPPFNFPPARWPRTSSKARYSSERCRLTSTMSIP